MSALNNSALIGASGSQGYQISRSVRLRSSASAYFNRTPGSASNRNTWTWSSWVKRGLLGSNQTILAAYPSATVYAYLQFNSSDQIRYASTNSGANLITTAVYRDPSSWYHIVFVYDDTQATSSNRLKLYVNGVQITAFGTAAYPTLNFGDYINSANVHNIGRFPSGVEYVDGYLTEVNFIDGQALTPSSFGETNTVTGVWQPKKYAGTYGTNGFYLNFSDNSAATAAAIGKDYSGNGNNWTPNNISVTAGATYDSMLDVPTQWADGGNGRGNYCVVNPLAWTGSAGSLANGNLQVVTPTAGGGAYGTFAMPSTGSWYWEFTQAGSAGGAVCFSGVSTGGSQYVVYYGDGQKYLDGVNSNYGAAYGTGDVIGVAVNVDSGQVTFYKNGASQGAISYTLTGKTMFPYFADGGSGSTQLTLETNFGQRPFAYTPPTGFKALNTLNLPAPTILKGNQYFDVSLYTGTGSAQIITNSGSMQPDLVWQKGRGEIASHRLIDSVRGVDKVIYSNLTNAEATETGVVSSFNSNGFTGGGANVVTSGFAGVAWQWKEGATQGFDIVTYTGTGVAQNISHNLGVAPRMIIVKQRNGTFTWRVYHASLANTQALYLSATDAATTETTAWNSTSPTSTVFTVGTSSGTNGNTNTYVAYLFSEVAGFSRFGSYTGNGSADGPFVFTGFRPRYVMIKGSSFASNWFVIDTSRSSYNVSLDALRPNLDGAEVSSPTTTYSIDILSNGFKLRTSAADSNTNGATFIYACFAENPFKNALAR